MCVIIVKEQGITIPEDKIASACTVNSDGWGLVAIPKDKKPLIYFPSSLDEKTKNNPEEVNHYLKMHTDDKVLLHLRFRTRGTVSLENAHPFLSYVDVKDDSKKIFFCHNGTFSTFDKLTDQPDKSDSYAFNELLIKPLLKKIIDSGTTFEKAIYDPLFYRIIDKCNSFSSIITLMDSTGQHINFNGSQGKQHEGWWSSNNYSFDRNHREPKSSTYNYGKVWKNGKLVDEDKKEEVGNSQSAPFREQVITETTATSITPTSTADSAKNKSNDSESKGSSTRPQSSYDDIAEMLLHYGKKKDFKPQVIKAKPSPNFYQLCSCKPDDLLQLSTEDIISLTTNYPNESALLIKNLLYINYMKNSDEGKELYVN